MGYGRIAPLNLPVVANLICASYLLLVVIGLEKLDALIALLFTSVKSVLESVYRLRHNYRFR